MLLLSQFKMLLKEVCDKFRIKQLNHLSKSLNIEEIEIQI